VSPDEDVGTHDEETRGRHRDRALMSAAGAAILSRLLVSVTAVLTLAIAAASLEKHELGVVAVLVTLATFLGFGDFGLGTLMMTRLPIANAKGDQEEMRLIVRVSLSTLCAIGATVIALGTISAFLTPWTGILGAEGVGDGPVAAAVVCFFVTGGLSIPAAIGSRILIALQRSSINHMWNAAGGLISLLLTITCAVLDAPIWAYVLSIAGTPSLIALTQTLWLFWRAYPELRPSGLRVPPRIALSYLSSGALFAVFSISSLVSYSIDSLVVSSILGAGAAAVFALAARMFTLVGGTLSLAGQQMWSAIADAVTRGDIAWVRSRYRHVLIISTGVNLAGCLFLVIFGRTISRVWVGSDLVPSITLLLGLAGWTVSFTAFQQAAYLLAATERIKVLAAAAVLMAPVNVALSIFFTHQYGMVGPVLGSIVALLLVVTIPVIVLTRREFDAIEERVRVEGAAAG
jgi:O-antigen/teichoic acid export membrane protein